ncbi:MAG: hypothetical protein ACM3PT_05730 [Deltaproteobacteria bacterium]
MMNSGYLYKEQENKRKGIVISIIFHILILLLALLSFSHTKPSKAIEKQYAIEITFDNRGASNSFKGRSAEGAQRPKHQEAELVGGSSSREVKVSNPTRQVPQPKVSTPASKSSSSKVESDIYEKQTDVFASSEAELEMNEIPRSKSSSSKKSSKVVVNSEEDDIPEAVPGNKSSNNKGSGAGTGTGKASGPGSGSASSSNSDGSGTGQGNKGSGSGNDKSGDDASSGKGTGGPGTGVFDGSGKGIFGRQPIKRPLLSELKLNQSGRMVFKICIDRKGRSTFVDFINNGSTIKDKKAIKLATDYIGRFVWEEEYSAQKEQCGKYTLIIENKK